MIYIVFCPATSTVESVWSTKALAKSARIYHANMATKLLTDYEIAKRELNTATNRKSK